MQFDEYMLSNLSKRLPTEFSKHFLTTFDEELGKRIQWMPLLNDVATSVTIQLNKTAYVFTTVSPVILFANASDVNTSLHWMRNAMFVVAKFTDEHGRVYPVLVEAIFGGIFEGDSVNVSMASLEVATWRTPPAGSWAQTDLPHELLCKAIDEKYSRITDKEMIYHHLSMRGSHTLLCTNTPLLHRNGVFEKLSEMLFDIMDDVLDYALYPIFLLFTHDKKDALLFIAVLLGSRRAWYWLAVNAPEYDSFVALHWIAFCTHFVNA